MSEITVGVIGLGVMGRRHAQVYRQLPGVRLHAVCDPDPSRAAPFADRGIRVHGDFESMLAAEPLDAVSICLPDDMHLPAVRAAVRAGTHILLEKPIATTLEDARLIRDLVSRHDRLFTVGHLLRFDPRYAEAHRAARSGELGQPISLSARRNSTIVGPRRYRGHTDLAAHVMIHDIDAANWILADRPVGVYARRRRVLLAPDDMTDTVFALVEYAAGTLACFEACWVLPESSPADLDDHMQLIGTRGVVRVEPCSAGVSTVLADRVAQPDSRHWPEANGRIGGALAAQLTDFVYRVAHGHPPLVTADDAVLALEVVHAIEASLSGRREISL